MLFTFSVFFFNVFPSLPIWAGRRLRHLRVEEDLLERLQDCESVREDPVREEEGVEEVDVEESEVGQALEEALGGGVADLGDLERKNGWFRKSYFVVSILMGNLDDNREPHAKSF